MTAPRPAPTGEPTDPDVDLRAPAERSSALRDQGPVVAVVAVGGAIGATARYAGSLLWPVTDPGFPWTTLLINVTGCAVIGVFMVLISEVWSAHRLVRPFFGTGVLGGYTTFSTYAVEIERLVNAGAARTALAYLFATLFAALGAVALAVALTRRVLAWRQS